uniref:Large envelope protein n=1 Tax=Hepatitis B virus TaxID=10407 RepID=A0A8F3CIL2_HBV|nr:MAG: S protein [Hepatitis B virus]
MGQGQMKSISVRRAEGGELLLKRVIDLATPIPQYAQYSGLPTYDQIQSPPTPPPWAPPPPIRHQPKIHPPTYKTVPPPQPAAPHLPYRGIRPTGDEYRPPEQPAPPTPSPTVTLPPTTAPPPKSKPPKMKSAAVLLMATAASLLGSAPQGTTTASPPAQNPWKDILGNFTANITQLKTCATAVFSLELLVAFLAALLVVCFLLIKILTTLRIVDSSLISLSSPGHQTCPFPNTGFQTSTHLKVDCPYACRGFLWICLRRFIIFLCLLVLVIIFWYLTAIGPFMAFVKRLWELVLALFSYISFHLPWPLSSVPIILYIVWLIWMIFFSPPGTLPLSAVAALTSYVLSATGESA